MRCDERGRGDGDPPGQLCGVDADAGAVADEGPAIDDHPQ